MRRQTGRKTQVRLGLRTLSGKQLVKNHPKRKYIGAGIAFALHPLLGRHIGGCPELQLTFQARLRSDNASMAEIAELHGPIGSEQDIFRLQIAVNDLLEMGRFEAVQDLPRDGQAFLDRHWPRLLH